MSVANFALPWISSFSWLAMAITIAISVGNKVMAILTYHTNHQELLDVRVVAVGLPLVKEAVIRQVL